MKHCLVFASLISPSKMILFEKKYQTFDTVFHHQMKHLEVRQKYSAARRIFNSLLGVSSGDETLHLMFDILLQILTLFQTKQCHFPHPCSDQAPKVHTHFQTRYLRHYVIIPKIRMPNNPLRIHILLFLSQYSFGTETTDMFIHYRRSLKNHS